MINKVWLQSQIDQAAATLRGQPWTTEEIATLSIATGLQFASMVLRASLAMDGPAREFAAVQLDGLREDLIGADEGGQDGN